MKARLVFLAFASGLSACGGSEIIATAPRPSSPDTIIVARDNGPATVAFGYAVKLTHGKDEIRLLYAEHSDEPRITWLSADRVRIDIPCGEISDYTNFAMFPSSDGKPYETIRIDLVNDGLCPRRG